MRKQIFIFVIVAACHTHAHDETLDAESPATDASVATTLANTTTTLRPLTNAEWLERLELARDGGKNDVAFVTVPLGATEPRPVLIALHGAGDHPGWSCAGWHGVTKGYPFIVCPQGTALNDGNFAWTSDAQIERIIDEALPALHERFGIYVSDAPLILAAFSQGARLGMRIVARQGKRFPRVVLVEGAWDEAADPSMAREFHASGGTRILLSCSTGGCSERFRASRLNLDHAGVDVRLLDAGPRGHNLNQEVVDALIGVWPWLVDDAPDWRSWSDAGK